MNAFFTRRPAGRLLLAALGLGVALGSPAWAQESISEELTAPAEAFGIAAPARTEKSLKPVRPTPSETWKLELANVPEVRLKAVDVNALLQADEARRVAAPVKYLRIGVGRDLAVAPVDGNWYDLAGGARLWVAEVASTDALGVRLQFQNVRLPQGAELAVYSPSGNDPGVLKNGSSRFDPDRYVEFYGASAASEFWTGTFAGDRVRVEYFAPAGADTQTLPFAVKRLQHIYIDPINGMVKNGGNKAAGPCHNDVTCFPEWADVAASVARISYITDGFTGLCTGQLLNSQKPDFTPYFLTAHHCMNTQAEAATTEFFWFYQTNSCGGTVPSLASVPRSRGASLLAINPATDATFLMVEGSLPDTVFWAGWTAAKIGDGVGVTAIHHPDGDFKRISFGNKAESSSCLASRPERTLRINWTDAPTEPGSSGSGIFRNDTGQLFGQLFFGPSSCGNETFDCYGEFAVTYPKLKKFLQKGGADDKSEQNDSCAKARNLRAGTQGNRIVKVLDTDWYKIVVPKGKTVTVRLNFANSNGDVDLAFFDSCRSTEPLAVSDGTGDEEILQITNQGNGNATGYFQVYLDSDTRNNYDIAVSFN